jgi:putative flippase GtrA
MLRNKWVAISENRFFVFVIYGGLNTLASYLLYLLLLAILHHQIAYLIAYLFGIALAYFLNLRFVFKSQSTLKKAASYPLVYVIQYIMGAVLFYVLVNLLLVSKLLAPLLVVAMLLPVSYFLNKALLLAARKQAN